MNSVSLAGLHVLVTRPQSQAEELISALENTSATVTAMPMMAIEAIDEQSDFSVVQSIKSTVMDLDQYQHVIFISTNAVNCAFYWIEQYWPQLPIGINWYAIGAATAAALTEYGPEPETGSASMNSEALLMLPSLQQLLHTRVAIFRGVGGREHLAEVLRQRGAEVTYCDVYKRFMLQADSGKLRQTMQMDGALVLTATSVDTLKKLLRTAELDGVDAQLKALPLLIPGQRVANAAREMGFEQLLIAENAGVKAFMSELITYQKNRT